MLYDTAKNARAHTQEAVRPCFLFAHSPEASFSPRSTQVLRACLSSTVLRRAGGDRPFPLLGRKAVLEETRGRKR